MTEFLPVSSTANLDIIQKLFHYDSSQNLLFDVMLHMGTLAALLVYFWREWADIFKANFALSKLRNSKDQAYAELKSKSMPLWPVIIALIPAAVAGLKLEHKIESSFSRNPALIAYSMIGFGILLAIADRAGRRDRTLHKASIVDWVIVGLAQAVAVIPGVSRSGATITAGLFRGFERDAAAKFSFMLGAPVIFGAGLLEVVKHRHELITGDLLPLILPLILGVITSAIVGYISIGFLFEYMKRRGVTLFVIYRICFGVVVLALRAFGVFR